MTNRRFLMRVAGLIAVVGLLTGACGGDSDDSVSPASGDADRGFVTEPEPAGDDGASGAAGSSEESSRVEASVSDDAQRDTEAGFAGGDALTGEEPAAESASESAPIAPAGGLLDRDERGAEQPDGREDAEAPKDTTFENYGVRGFVETNDDPLSTFALDVDTGSYSVGRSYLNNGLLPPADSVRVEEYVNAFDYDYDDPDEDLGITIEGGPSPFDDDNYIVRIGINSEILDDDDRPGVALTFVIDTSGSMRQDDRLELVKDALEELVEELDSGDTIAIVEFDDNPSIVLEPTRVDDIDEILDAIDDLEPGGSTNVEAGLELGYDLAGEAFDDDRVNRVILLSDGVANVGLTDPDGLARMIRRDADRGINLLTVGVGMGNFNDVLMEQLADHGDGFYAYVDTKDEAERLFEDDLTATLVTLAIDAKVQVAFDEDIVEEYRLIGFENRGVLDSDFRNDEVDAGELGAGHQVTAIYEVELERGVDIGDRGELGEVSLRWQVPGSDRIVEIDEDIDLDMISSRWTETSESFQLAVVVATFAEVLRGSPFADRIDLDDLEEEIDALADRMNDRDVDELADLVALAERLG